MARMRYGQEPARCLERQGGHDTHESARVGRVFKHRRPRRRPIAIAEPTDEAQIIEAVKLAMSLKFRVSVRSGGHSWAAWSGGTVRMLCLVGSYCKVAWGGIARYRISLTPALTDTDMAGIQQNWGWACEKILALDMVTSNGELIHVNEHHHQVLCFAARGAGSALQVIMMRSTFIYPIARYDEVLTWLIKISPDFEFVAVSAVPPGMTERCIIAQFVVFKHTE
ncbi:hypothetical protein FGADI_657 [Fusarium gaditjirri]|uniref:FAD-binding PCMH-type domain-containing protein n=1 Tax=Fusarium gaditjirri TaxID=282569 RepID=A0A8H4TN45_9HYPO|nr:hypothetical protein FGADI_657 [Fusarium gaditjirri]